MTDDERVWPQQDWRDESKQPHCEVCGRFAYKAVDDLGRFIEWRLKCVWRDWEGWHEHE